MKKVVVLISALIIILAAQAVAVPPDSLDFGVMKYYKERSLLYYDQVHAIPIATVGDTSFPSAVVFKDSIIFLTSDGNRLKSELLPNLINVGAAVSQTGKYLYVFGPYRDKPGGVHKLFDSAGNELFSRIETSRTSIYGYGMPLEKSQCFLSASNGKVAITSFDGNPVYGISLLKNENYEDGDIIISITPNERKVFAAVNKFKMPKEGSLPEFVALDEKLQIISRRPLPYQLIINQQCSSDGRFIMLRVELKDGTSPVIVCDSTGQELLRLDNPQFTKFSSDAGYLFNVKRSAKAAILQTASWDSVYAPYIPVTGFNWIDADISDDGNIVAFFEGNRLLLGNRELDSSSYLPFPYSFRILRLYDRGKRMVLSGEFGAVVYRMVN